MDLIKSTLDEYYYAVYDTNRDRALKIVEEALQSGVCAEDIVFKIVIPTVERMVVKLIEQDEITLSQHYIASKVAEEVTDKMIPLFEKSPRGKGKIVIGSSSGDFHGLGKKIVSGCLLAYMYEVHDVGLNVKPEKFIEKAIEIDANIIGISSMMLHTAKSSRGALAVRQLLQEEGLEDQIKIVVGGAPYCFNENLCKEVKADGWAKNGIEAVHMIENLIKGVVSS